MGLVRANASHPVPIKKKKKFVSPILRSVVVVVIDDESVNDMLEYDFLVIFLQQVGIEISGFFFFFL
jgi:hypothetical protein